MELSRLENESQEYRRKRDELRRAELELMRQRERVAALRRALPQDTVVEDYAFVEGPRELSDGDAPAREVSLSELFSAPERALVIYHFMYGKAQQRPCPMCTMWIAGFNAVAPYLDENLDFAIAAAAELGSLRGFARERGWHNLRLLACGTSSFKHDLGSEDADGHQYPLVSVFTLGADRAVRHFYSGSAQLDEGARERGIDLLSPVWHLLDLTPRARGDWYPSLPS
jgi:predicted dithiol-disulfide oxidoreductase (DUF899 family)